MGSSGALIKDSHIQHVEKEQQERYEYPAILHLTVPRGMSQHKLLTDLKAHTRGAQICYSSYGSPYECTVPAPKVTAWGEKEGTAEVRFVGRSFRRHDIANLTQQKAEERKRKHIKEPTEEGKMKQNVLR